MEQMKQYEILYKKAKTDLKVSKNLFEDFNNGDDELDMETIMFHLQQSAKKLLKSLLSYNQYHITKTHNIEFLIITCKENGISLVENIESLIPLSEYAVEGRYAVIHDDLGDADIYLKLLDELLVFVKKEVGL